METPNIGCTRLYIKLAALMSFAGGPLVLADQLKPSWGLNVAFGISFLPVGLMIMGVLTLAEDGPGTLNFVLVVLGIIGAALCIPLQLWGAYMLAANPQQPDHTLKTIGVLIGLVVSMGFAYAAWRWNAARRLLATDDTDLNNPRSRE